MAIDDTILDGGSPLSDYSSTTLGYQPATRTANDIANAVRRQFGDEAGVQIIDSDVLRWINDAQDTIVNRGRPLKARAFTDSIKGVSAYKFPSNNILQIESLHYAGKLLPNTPFPQAERELIGRTDVVGEPQTWWEWSGEFTIFPAPPESQPIVLFYTVGATSVAYLSDTLGVPDKYFQTVLSYVMQQAYELDENFQAAQTKQQQFSQNLDGFEDEERTAQHMTFEGINYVNQGW